MSASFDSVISVPSRTENTTSPVGRDNRSFGRRCHCNRRGHIIYRYEKIPLFIRKEKRSDTSGH